MGFADSEPVASGLKSLRQSLRWDSPVFKCLDANDLDYTLGKAHGAGGGGKLGNSR